MLAHPHLARFTFKVPIKTVVIDEASQIAVADYIAPLQSFPTIEKLCFIGDDKQCKVSIFSVFTFTYYNFQCHLMARRILKSY